MGIKKTRIEELISKVKIALIDPENFYNLLCLFVAILAKIITPLFFSILLLDIIKWSKIVRN